MQSWNEALHQVASLKCSRPKPSCDSCSKLPTSACRRISCATSLPNNLMVARYFQIVRDPSDRIGTRRKW